MLFALCFRDKKCSFCQNWSEHQWDLFENRRSYIRRWFDGKLLEQHIRLDSFQGKEMKIMKRQVTIKGPAGTGWSQPNASTALDAEGVASSSINIKESYPSKSTRCFTIQNSSEEDESSHETEERSSHYNVSSRSPATDRLTQSQKATEIPNSSGQSNHHRQMTKSTGHWTYRYY